MILQFLENRFCEPRTDDDASVLLKFRNGEEFTVGDSFEGICIPGGIGSGKSTLAITIRHAFLSHGYGLLVLCVKKDEANSWVQVAQECGRGDDVVLFRANGPHQFNPFSAADPLTVVGFLDDFGALTRTGDDSFWVDECTKIARNAAVVTSHALGYFDLGVMTEVIRDHAKDSSQVASKQWQERSVCYQLLLQAESKSPRHRDLELAREFFLDTFPSYGGRTQGSVLAVVGNMLENFRREPFRTIFGGCSTVTPEDILNRGKIVIVDVPVLENRVVGTIANAVWLYAFCRALTKRTSRRPAALWIDEAQYLISPELMRTQTVIRSHRVSTVLLFQNLAVLEEKLSGKQVEGLLGTLNTVIFTRQPHASTRLWAADKIGKRKKIRVTRNRGNSFGRGASGTSSSVTKEEIWDYLFQPDHFSDLKTGGKENGYKVGTIVSMGAKAFRAKWHQIKPGSWGTVRPKF